MPLIVGHPHPGLQSGLNLAKGNTDMTEFQINDHLLQKECAELAREIFDEVMEDKAGDHPEDYRDEMDERAHETADGHQWVIYTYKAHMLCAHCDVSNGEEFLADVGVGPDPTYDSLGTMIAYGEMRARIMAEIDELIEAWEPPAEDMDDEDVA